MHTISIPATMSKDHRRLLEKVWHGSTYLADLRDRRTMRRQQALQTVMMALRVGEAA